MSNNAIEIRKRKRADAKITSNNGGLLGGIGYAGEKVLLGALQSVEGTTDFIVGGIADLVGAEEYAKQVMDDDWVDYGHADKWYNPKGAMKVVGDVAGGIGTSLPAIGAAIGAGAITYASGGAAAPAAIKLLGAAAAPLVAGTGAAGNATKEAYRETGNLSGKEWGYGVQVGVTEAGVELLTQGIGTGTGRIAKEIGKGAAGGVVKGAGKYGVKGVLKTLGADMLSEGIEEGIATYMAPKYARATYDPHAEDATAGEILYDSFIGSMSSLILGGTTNAISYGKSVNAGKKVSDAGKADTLVKQAKYGLLKLGQDAKASDTFLEGIDDLDGGILAKRKLKSEVKKTAKNRAEATEAVEQALARWESLSDKQRASLQGYEVLGDLQRNDFLLRANSWVEDRVGQLSKQSDEKLADVAAQVKETVGEEYTIEDLRADKNDILTRIAANELSLTGVEFEDTDDALSVTAASGSATSPVVGGMENDAVSGAETVDAPNDSARSFDTFASQTAQDDTLVGGLENDVAAIRAEAKALGVDESYTELAVKAYEVGGLRDLSAADFTRSFISAVRMAEDGATAEGLLKEAQVARLDNSVRQFAGEAGRKIAANKKASARAKAKRILNASRTGYVGEVILADGLRASKDFNDRQYAAYKAAELMAKALGTDIVLHRSLRHAGKVSAGYFDPSDGSIHININAMRKVEQGGKWDGKNIALYTLGHETVHFIKAWTPAKYAELESFVMEKLGDRAEALMKAKRAQLDEMGDLKGLSDTEADALVREEVVADAMEGVLSDGEVLAELQQRNRTLWEKIKTFVTSVIERVKAAYGDLSGVSKTAQVLSETVESLDQVKRLFTEGVVDASEARKSGGVNFSFGVTQKDIDKYVDAAYAKQNTEDYKAYAEVDERLMTDVSTEIDLTGYAHALRDNDIRHIRNSHGENTNEKYPVTKEDIAQIPNIVANYDKVFVKSNANGDPGLVYVKVGANNVTYYVEAVTTQYHNKKLLVNKQMIKTGISEIPNLVGLISAITKKESSSQYLADLEEIRKAYVRDVKENYSMNIVPQVGDSVKRKFSVTDDSLIRKYPYLDLNQDISALDGVPAVRLTDGSVLTFTEPHVQFIQNSGLDVDDIESGGWVSEGIYEASERSDTLRYKERMQAKKRMDAKRADKRKFSTSDDITESGAVAAGQEQAITVGMSDSARAEILKHKKIAPTVVEIHENFDVDWEALEKNRKSVVEKPLLEKMQQLGYIKRYSSEAIQVRFDFTGRGFRKSMNSQVSDYGGTLADFAKVVMNMQGLLDGAVLLEIHSDKAVGTKKANAQLLQTYVLLSAYQEGTQITPVQFEIKQYVDEQNRLYLAVAMTKIEADVISDTALQEGERTRLLPASMASVMGDTILDENQASTRLLPASTYSIADFVQKINPRDENFFKYIPDEFLTAEQKVAKQRALAKENAKYGRKFSVSDDITESGDVTEGMSHEIVPYQEQEKGMVGYVFDGEFMVADSNSMHRRLAEAMESMVDNSTDYSTLKKYKERLWELDELQSKQQMLRESVDLYEKVLYEGATPSIRKEGYARLQEVRAELNKVSRELAHINKSLLGMSTLQPIRNLLAQERKNAKNYYREKYQKMDQERVEKRNRSEGARKLEKKLRHLYRRFFAPTKKWHIPTEMQKEVKAALAATNMETEWVTKVANLEAELERLEGLRDKGVPNQQAIAEVEAELEAVMAERESLSEQMKFGLKLFELFGIAKSETVNSAFDGEMHKRLLEYQEIVGDTPIYELTAKQLEAANQFYQVLITRIGVANQLFLDGKQQALETEGNKAIDEIDEIHVPKWLKPRKGEKGATTAGKKLFWDSLKPPHFFEIIGSNSLLRVFKDLRRGEGKWARVIRKAERFADKTAKKYKYHQWDLKTRHNFQTANGKTISLTLDEMMALYELYQRPAAYKNLTEGGVKHSPDATTNDTFGKTKLPKPKSRLNDNTRYVWDEASFQKVFDALTDEQKAFADEMQRYMAEEMGALGNEVSLYLYGIEMFTDPNYFTMDVDDSVTASQTGRTGDPKITNKSFTQRVTEKGSSAPLILHGLMDVWTAHVNDMALYHAFAIPTDNLSKMLNYKKTAVRDADTGEWTGKAVKDMKSESLSLKDALISQYGEQSVKYIEQLLRDLNGGARTDGAADLLSKGLSLFKRASVVGSLSVVFQQPASIGRAFSMIHPKYLANAKGFNFKDYEAMQAELEEFAPLATIKDMGGFDTGIGSRTADYMMPKEYKGFKKKALALATDSNYRNEVFGFLANKADQLAWFTIWEGCKREQAELLKKPMDSKEVLEAAGERFEDIIVHTQVYDSTLSRSQIMRSKDTGAQMVTTFMAEPTTTANMMMVGLVQFSRTKNAKILRNVIGSVLVSAILQSLLASLIYAARDDDEEKNYGEKYVEQLTGGLMDSMNPLTYFPYLRDIWSIAQGYEVERSDMAVVYDFYNAINGMGSSEKSWLEKSMNLGANVGTLFGLPTRNIYRDARGIHNVFTNAAGDGATAAGAKYAMKESAVSMIPFAKLMGIDAGTSNGYQLYDAMVAGDEAHIKRVKARFESDAKANAALRTALRDKDARIRQAAMARYEGDMATYSTLVREVKAEGIFSQDLIVTAVNAEMNAIKRDYESGAEDNADPDAVDEAAVEGALYTSADLNGQLEAGDYAEAKVIITDMVNAKMASGKTKKQAQALVKSGVTRYWKEKYLAAYKSKNAAECKRIRAVLKQTGLYGTASEILEVTQGWVKG